MDENKKTLYEQAIEASKNPEFESPEALLEYCTKEYERLGGNEFWLEAESASLWNENHIKIMSLQRRIHMAKYLIDKEKNE